MCLLEKSLKSYVERYQSINSEYEDLNNRVIYYDFNSGSKEEWESLCVSLNEVKDKLNIAGYCLFTFILDHYDLIKFE